MSCFVPKDCRRVLCGHGGNECKPHVCGDIMERVSPAIRDSLRSMREEYAERLRMKCAFLNDEKDVKARWVTHFNKLFLDGACRLLGSVEFSREDKGYCYKCRSMVRLHPPASKTQLLINISGTTCVAWSAMSQGCASELAWLHPSADPCLLWLHEQAAIRPHYVIHECVRGFDPSCFKRILGDGWHISTVRFSAKSTGVPVDRTRSYTVACSQPAHCQLPFDMDLVKSVLYHDLECDCSIYLQADEMSTMKHRELLAPLSVRHLALKKRYPTSALLPTGDAYRLGLWKDAIEAKVLASDDEMKDIVKRHFVNVAQEAGFMALPKDVVVPALLRGSKLFSVSADRWIHPAELLAIQGVPMFLGDKNAFTKLSPFRSTDVSLRAMAHMAGNAMHVGVVGGVFLLAVSSFHPPDQAAASEVSSSLA